MGILIAAMTLQRPLTGGTCSIQSGVSARVDNSHHKFEFFSLCNDSRTLWGKGASLIVKISALTLKKTEFTRIKDIVYSANDRDSCKLMPAKSIVLPGRDAECNGKRAVKTTLTSHPCNADCVSVLS